MSILEFAHILADFSETSFEDWQTQRRAQMALGGSDAGTILGLNKFKDEYTLYLERIGEVEPGGAGEAAEWGHTLEPVVAEKWLERHGKPMGLSIEPFPYLLQSIEFPFMLANMDRLIRKGEDFGILEVKTASEYLNGEWENGEILSNGFGTGKVPPKYYAQLQHYFAVTGITWGFFCALVGGNKLYSVYVERNEEYIGNLVLAEAMFMQRVEMRIPPELNGSETCKTTISNQYPTHSEEFQEIEDVEFGEWLLTRNELKDTIQTLTESHKITMEPLETQLSGLETKMKAKIADNKGVMWQGHKITWGERSGRRTVDMKLLEEKYPDIAQEVIKLGDSYRQLSFSKPKTKGKGV